MQFEIGMIVKSISGHDKDRFYVLVGLEKGYGYIADGKRRKLEKPKRKNIIHLSKTNCVLKMDSLDTNLKLRRALWSHNDNTIAVAD